MRLPVVGSAYAHGRTEVTARAAKNLWFERRPDGEKAPVIVSHLPAAVQYTFSQTVDAPFAFISTDVGYYYVATTTKLFGMSPGSGIVTFNNSFPVSHLTGLRMDYASDDTRIVMVTFATASYCAVTGGAITEITVEGQTPVSVAYLKGYFVMLMESGRLYWSTDGSTWNALDYANAEYSPDAGRKIVALGNVLIIFGAKTIEYWAPTGNVDLPFEPIPEAVIRMGLRSSRAAVMIDGQVYFWGAPDNGTQGLFTLDGTTPVRLSPPDLELILSVANVLTPTVSGFSIQGRKVIALQMVPSDEVYWLDLASGAITRIPPGSPFSGRCEYISDGIAVYGLSEARDNHFRLDPTTFDATVERELITDHVVTPDLDRFTVDKVRLDVAAGGNVALAVSRDGGQTWGTERSAPASAGQGVRGTVSFDRYGTANQFTFRLRATGKLILSNIIINPKN
ncbi:MAG: hypothetical protein KF822_09490 [Steroidobacteraceae bacterium]|nr:hypothetical protein [Steroidobacteraceae bacterium]